MSSPEVSLRFLAFADVSDGWNDSKKDACEASDSDRGLVPISAGWVRPDGAGPLDRDEPWRAAA